MNAVTAINNLIDKLSPYSKAVVAVGGVVVLIGKALADSHISSDELLAIGTAIAVALGVYQLPNKKN